MKRTQFSRLKWAACGFVIGLIYFAATADYGRIDANESRRIYHTYVVTGEIVGGAVAGGIFGVIFATLGTWFMQSK